MLWIFDLDHTLVESSLDLARVKAEIAQVVAPCHGGSPEDLTSLAVSELAQLASRYDRQHGTALAARVWQIVAQHEHRALDALRPMAGAADTLAGLRRRGDAIAVWTNNARATAQEALLRCGLAPLVDALVSRDDVVRLKPAPDGYRVLKDRWEPRKAADRWDRKAHPAGTGRLGRLHPGAVEPAVMVGDSWIDGAAAAAAGLPFVAFGGRAEGWVRRGIPLWRHIRHLRELLDVPVPDDEGPWGPR